MKAKQLHAKKYAFNIKVSKAVQAADARARELDATVQVLRKDVEVLEGRNDRLTVGLDRSYRRENCLLDELESTKELMQQRIDTAKSLVQQLDDHVDALFGWSVFWATAACLGWGMYGMHLVLTAVQV